MDIIKSDVVRGCLNDEVVEEYFKGTLNDASKQEFENHIMDCIECWNRVMLYKEVDEFIRKRIVIVEDG